MRFHEPKDTQNSITKFSGELTREIYIHANANQGPGTKVVICVVGYAFAIPYSVEFALTTFISDPDPGPARYAEQERTSH